MNLTSPSQVKAWCIEHDFHPNKVLGQNFLIDKNILLSIVDTGLEGAGPEPSVLEIGPGLGVLTQELLTRGAHVTAIEKDPVLGERLAASLGNPPNLTVVTADALDWIAGMRRENGDVRDVRGVRDVRPDFTHLVSNLPYQAGTRILLDILITRQIPALTILVQTEVAERLAAPEGSKTRALAGVFAQLDYDVRVVRKVPPTCFWPRPAVSSAIVKLTRHERNAALTDQERRTFRSLAKQAFEHRRKQLGTIFKDLIQSTLRAEDLSNEEWVQLAKDWTQRYANT